MTYEVPLRVRISPISLRMSFTTMNYIGELHWISYEEEWSIIHYEVTITYYLKINSSQRIISLVEIRHS